MSEIKNFILFGCESVVGQDILRRGMQEDLEVAAFTLYPNKIPDDINRDSLTVIEGDVLDKDEVEDAIKGYDAVLSALESGTWFGNTTLMSQGCRNIISAMKKHNMTRIAVVSNAIGLPRKKRFLTDFMIKWGGYSDYMKVLQILEEEAQSMNWITMMAPEITKSSAINPDYKVERNNIPGEWTVTSGELADFMVKVFMDRTSTECFRHNKLGISSRPKQRFKVLRWALPAVSVMVALFAFLAYGGCDMLPSTLQEFLHQIFDPERFHIQDEQQGILQTAWNYIFPS